MYNLIINYLMDKLFDGERDVVIAFMLRYNSMHTSKCA